MRWRLSPLLILFLALATTTVSAEEKKSVGVLVDLSGGLATYGNDIKNTLEIAKEDINNYFKEKGLPYEIEFYYEDTRADPKVTLEKVQSLYARGINIILGPLGSGEVANIKDYVTSNKIVVVSPSSTALPTIIGFTKPEEKKYIFRLITTDNYQTRAIVKELEELGIKGVVMIYLGNAWGKGLYECIKPELEKKGIKLQDAIEYPDPAPADFSPYIAKLESGVNELLKTFKPNEVAIIAFCYEEVANILAQTSDDSVLFKVTWLGSDAIAQSTKVLEVADKAQKVGLYSTVFEAKGPALENLKKKYQEKGYGECPHQYALNAYDAAWIIALAYAELMQEKGSYDPDAMVEKIRKVTEKYSEGEYGFKPVTGYIKLNEWNDRSSGDYAIYYVAGDKWVLAGIWKFETGSIEWFHKPALPAETPTETATPTETPVETKTPAEKVEKKGPGFETIFAVAGLVAVAYLTRRKP